MITMFGPTGDDLKEMQRINIMRDYYNFNIENVQFLSKKNSSKLNNKFGSVVTTENHCLYCGSIVYGERCESCGARR